MQELYDISIERSLLSAILFDVSYFDRIENGLTADDFGYKPHSKIYSAMVELHKEDLPLNEDFLRKKLPQDSSIDNAILELLATQPVVELDMYIKEIKDLALKRKLRQLATFIAEKSALPSTSSNDIINEVERAIFALSSHGSNGDFRHVKEITQSMLERIEKLKQEGNKFLRGVDTGFRDLNRLTTGFNNGELIVLAARPGMGKTALAINMMLPTLKNGKGVAFFSCEMPAEQIAMRMFSSLTGIALQRLIKGDLDDNEWARFSRQCDESSTWNLYIDDSGGLDITHLRSKLRKLKLKNSNIELAIVDYLQIMNSISSRERHLEVAEISRGLKILARELDIPILALSQLNRSLESRSNRRPMLSDLRESGSIEQDADIILFIYRDAEYKRRDQREKIEQAKKEGKNPVIEQESAPSGKEEVELIIGKHRNGPNGTIKLIMDAGCMTFVDVDKNEIEQKPTQMHDVFIESI